MDNVIENIWKYIGGDQKELLSVKMFGGYKAEAKKIPEERERQALRYMMEEEEHLEIYGV